MVYNTILIKRRIDGSATAPASLSGGELAFNEVNKTLYYGASSTNGGVIAIAGDGAFVNRTSSQTISGDKTFVGSTTLGQTTFTGGSTLDFGGNTLTNLGAPALSSDASTKQYVDDEIASLAGSGGTAVTNLSTEVYNTFVKLTDDRAVNLTGGLDVTGGVEVDTLDTTGNATVGGNLTVTGDLQVLGAVTSLETTTTVTSAFSITNTGSQTAFIATQTGAQNVAEFYDDANIALAIVDGGNVGIGTLNPNEKLTVSGNVSASGTIYGAGGLEISSGTGATVLFVENGKVGINTETPNEALTVSGNVSATGDFNGVNAGFSGTLNVAQATTLASSVSAVGAVEFDSTLNVDGAVGFGNNLSVTGTSTFTGSVTASGNITGTDGSSTLINFLVDGGTF